MDLFDTRRPDPTSAGPALDTARPLDAHGPASPEAPDPMAPVHGAINTGLRTVYGNGWEGARSAIETAAYEGDRPATYARVKSEPEAFGAVRDGRMAETLGGALSVRDKIAATVGQPPGCPECRHDRFGDRMPVGVENTVVFIRQRLAEGFRNPVDAADLCAMREAIEANQGVASQIVERLGTEDLGRWMARVETSSERDATFGVLAESLDAPRLVQVIEALTPTHGTRDPNWQVGSPTGPLSFDIPDRSAVALGEVVAQNTPDLVRAELIETVLGGRGPNEVLHNNHNLGVVTCRAIGSLASNPTLLTRSVRNATAPDFRELLDAGTTRSENLSILRPGSVPVYIYDSEAAGWMLYGMSRANDTPQRSAAFVAGARHLDRLRAEQSEIGLGAVVQPALAEISKGLTHILHTEPNGMMERLRSAEDTDGSALASYLETLVGAGDTRRIAGQLRGLQLGDDRRGNALERLASTSTNPYTTPPREERGTALSIGHYLGATYTAFERRIEAGEADAAALNTLFGLIAAGAPGPRIGVPVSIIDNLTQGAIGGRIADLEQMRGQFKQAGVPFVTTDTETPARYDGAGARDVEDQFDHARFNRDRR